jgi:hypothetical protein
MYPSWIINAPAAINSSGKPPVSRPCLFVHSNMNAHEFMDGYILFMYEPSVTATSVLFLIAFSIQLPLPAHQSSFHNQSQSHESMTSLKVDGIVTYFGWLVCEMTQ